MDVLEIQKKKSSSHRSKTNQPQKSKEMDYKRITKRFLKEVKHCHLTNDIKSDVDKIRIFLALLERSNLN